MLILVLNAGSSSLKGEVFSKELVPLVSGQVTEIGGAGKVKIQESSRAISCENHTAAIEVLLDGFSKTGYGVADFSAVAHRVVHGGKVLTEPKRVDAHVLEQIKACIPLAPLHNPSNIAGIEAIGKLLPDMAQFVSFDTAFHASNPDIETTYAIPSEIRNIGIRRYGFHGLSYAGMVAQFGDALPERVLAFHLGNGTSVCSIKNGRSVSTSMGYSPLDGLSMGTRSGSIDGMAVLSIAQRYGVEQTTRILNNLSGLKALGGTNDMAVLLSSDNQEAKFAVDYFCYWAARHAGSGVVAMGGVDAFVFTGGIGENSSFIRNKVMEHLSCFGDVQVLVHHANEERQIATDALSVMARAA